MSFYTELKRRNVIRVGIAYLALSWIVLQAADTVFGLLQLPGWADTFVLVLVLLGFVPALVFAWVFELTPEGLKREADLPATPDLHRAKRLDTITIMAVVIGVVLLALDRLYPNVQPQAEPSSAAIAGAEAPLTPIKRKSIAVLPFINLSSDPDQQYFADGITEQLLDSLARLPDLLVTARTSSFALKGSTEDVRTIAAMLGVEHIVEGSVRRADNQVRITVQLVRAADGFHLWSQTYDRELDDVFAVQDDVAVKVAEVLEVVLDEERRQRMRASGVQQVEAYVHYQRGRALYSEAHGTGDLVSTLGRANEEFARALAIAPHFTEARFLMTDYYAHQIWEQERPVDEREQLLLEMRDLLDDAYRYETDPDRRALINVDRSLFQDNWTGLREVYARALQSQSCIAANYLELVSVLDLAAEAIAFYRRQMQCNPLDMGSYFSGGMAAIWAARPEEALQITTVEAHAITHNWVAGTAVRAQFALGRFEEALIGARELDPADPFYGNTLALMLAGQGDIDAARASHTEWEQRYGQDMTGGLLFAAAVGDREAANRIAAAIDPAPAGSWILMEMTYMCACGAPFDIEYAPVLRSRIEQAGITWPPLPRLQYPAKNW